MTFDLKIMFNALLGAAAAILIVEFTKSKLGKSNLENADDDDYN